MCTNMGQASRANSNAASNNSERTPYEIVRDIRKAMERSPYDEDHHITKHDLYRDANKNSGIVKDMLSVATDLIYFIKHKTIAFLYHEGDLGEVNLKDDMNVRQLAKNLGIRYDEVR